MKLLIALHHPFPLWQAPEWLASRLRGDFPQITVTQLPGPKYVGLDREIEDADVVIAWSIKPEQFRCNRKLRWIHSPAAAVHQLMFKELVESPVRVTNAREVHGPVVAEHILAVMFALAKRLPSAMRYQRDHVWAQSKIWEETPTVRELNGASVAMLGMGTIGREFTARARALGVRVLAVRDHVEKGRDGADEVFSVNQLEAILPRADFVVLATPLTPATRGIMDASRIAKMRPDAYLINVGRGQLIDDEALIAVLRARKIAGAALDVFVDEPLPADSPYWDLDNCLVTPHIAAITEKLWERHYVLILDNLNRFMSGTALRGLVSKEKGF